jgi:hypothetical protein
MGNFIRFIEVVKKYAEAYRDFAGMSSANAASGILLKITSAF